MGKKLAVGKTAICYRSLLQSFLQCYSTLKGRIVFYCHVRLDYLHISVQENAIRLHNETTFNRRVKVESPSATEFTKA